MCEIVASTSQSLMCNSNISVERQKPNTNLVLHG